MRAMMARRGGYGTKACSLHAGRCLRVTEAAAAGYKGRRAVGEQLMQAWDYDAAHHEADWGGSYAAFLERLFREVLARHSPAVSVRTPANG